MDQNTRCCYIATPVDMNNYGNRLQNFAVHWICSKMGLTPVTLMPDDLTRKMRAKNMFLQTAALLHLDRITRISPMLSVITKQVLAARFTRKYIRMHRVKDEKDLERKIKPSDYVGVGGDQIWSEYWRSKIWFARFALVDQSKKICFSPSFGSSTISDEHSDIMKTDLTGIEYLAVREESGVDIIKKITGRQAQRICDPVVQLSNAEWNKYCQEITPLMQEKEKYILLYFIGPISIEKYEWIRTVKNEFHLETIDVSRGNENEAIDPLDFVALIRDAFLVCTDSFHAIMIALIMKSKTVIFEREGGEKMNTRINEIIERYGLESWCYKSNMSSSDIPILDEDYIQSVLQEEREKGYEYYKSVIRSI